MSVEHVEILVEEPSMEALLRILMPRLLDDVSFEIYPSSCKAELLKNLPARLRGYAPWLPASWRIVVVVDRDGDECHTLKQELETMARAAGLVTRSAAAGGAYMVINRLVIEELEAWYFGDWEAVHRAYPKVSANTPQRAQYRNPDAIAHTWEAFESELRKFGYFRGGLRKIEAARAIAPYMDPWRNASRSFRCFRDAVVELLMPSS